MTEYLNGKPHGISVGYYEDGQKFCEARYHFGEFIEEITWHRNGTKRSEEGRATGSFSLMSILGCRFVILTAAIMTSNDTFGNGWQGLTKSSKSRYCIMYENIRLKISKLGLLFGWNT